MLGRRRTNPPVLPDKGVADEPCTGNRRKGKGRRRAESNDVARLVVGGPQVRAVDVTNLSTDVGHSEDDSLLLLGLRQGRRRPADDNGVDRVRARCKDEEGHVAGGDVEGCRRDDESDNGGGQTGRDMPGALMEASR